MAGRSATAHASGLAVCDRLPLVTVEVSVGSRLWAITTVQNQDALVDLLEDLEHLPFGFLLWESAIALARRICEQPELAAGKRVLELGCGVGLPGLAARSLGASVTQTDHQPGVLALARKNAAANGIDGVEQVLADWADWRIADRYDLVMGADILYVRDMHYHLTQIFRASIAPGGSLLLTDPGRPQSVEFLDALERTGWQIDMETTTVRPDHEGADAKDVEVAIVSARLPS